MPIRAEVEGLGVLEFEDGTPDSVVQNTVRKQLLGRERAVAEQEAETAGRFASAVDTVSAVMEPFSIGGWARRAKATAIDLMTPQPMGLPIGFTQSAQQASAMGEPLPPNQAKMMEESVIKSGIAAGAEALPAVGASVALMASGVPAPLAMAIPMGAQATEATGSLAQGARAAAIGAAIPPLARVGAMAGAAATGAAVNRGVTALANPVIQRAIEAGAAQVPVQALLLGDLIQSDQYAAATPDQQKRMIAEFAIGNLAFGIPEAARAFNPNVRPMAQGFENNAVALSRAIESAPLTAQEGALGPSVVEQGWQVRSAPIVLPAGLVESSPLTARALADHFQMIQTPETGQAMGLLEAQYAPDVLAMGEAPAVKGEVSGGQVSFAAEAPTLLRNRQEQIPAPAPVPAVPEAPPEVVRGSNEMQPYRRPVDPPTPEEYARNLRRASVEAGMFQEVEQPPVEPTIGQYPESGMPTGVLSEGQRRQITARLEREAGLRPGRRVEPQTSGATRVQEQAPTARSVQDQSSLGTADIPSVPAGETAPGQVATQEGLTPTERTTRETQAQGQEEVLGGTARQMSILPGGKEVLDRLTAATAEANRRLGLADELAGKAPGEQMRKFAARASTSKEVPEEIRKRVTADPRSFYDPQNIVELRRMANVATDSALEGDMSDPTSNTAVMSGLERVRRALRSRQEAIDSGDTKLAEGFNSAVTGTLEALAKRGTTLGQLVNQFKELKGSVPEYNAIIVNKILAQHGYDPLNPAQVKRLTELTAKAIESRDAREVADKAYQKAPSPEAWADAQEAARVEQIATSEMNYYMARKHPRMFGDMILAVTQGNSLTPKSQVSNVVGNTIGLITSDVARAGASVADAVGSFVLRKPRTIKYYPVGETVARFRALGRAAGISWDILKRGSDTAHIEAGQHGGVQLNSVRAWRDMKNIWLGESPLPTKGGKVPKMDMAKLVLEGSPFGISADIWLRGLGAMDALFRYPERARLIYERARNKGLSHEEALKASERPDAFLTEKDMAGLEQEASRTVLQQDNLATQLVSQANKTIKERAPGLYTLGRIGFSLFQKTPINALAELMSWSPLGAAKLLGRDVWKSRREANLQAAKIAVGSAAIAGGVWAYRQGVISAPLDNSEEAQKVRVGTKDVLPPGHINLTGLKRAMNGESGKPRAGDDIRDLKRLGLPGGLLYLSAMAARAADTKREGEGNAVAEVAAQAVPAVTSWAMNQTFLQGANDFLKSITQDGGEKWIVSAMSTAGNAIAPNYLATVSQAIRDSKPEFRDDSALQAVGKRLNEKYAALGVGIPGVKKPSELPPKIDLWGRPMKQHPPGANPWVYSFFDITAGGTIPDDPASVTLYNLWRKTLDDKVYPAIPARVVTEKGERSQPLDYELWSRLQEHVGTFRKRGVDALVNRPEFQMVGDGEKIKILRAIYDKGAELGEAQFKQELVDRGISLEKQKPMRGAAPK